MDRKFIGNFIALSLIVLVIYGLFAVSVGWRPA